MRAIEVVAAVIRKGGNIFATQRGYGEFKDWCELTSKALHLNEHEASAWLGKENLQSVKWLPADLALLDIIESSL